MSSDIAKIDPARADAVAPALGRFIAGHLNVPAVRFAEPPQPVRHGWDTYIYFFRLRGEDLPLEARADWSRPLVLRLYADAAQLPRAETDVAIQRFVVERGYPAAPPLVVIDPSASSLELPFVIMERLAGEPMLSRVSRNPVAGFAGIRRMAELHAALHRLDPAGWPLPTDGTLVDRALEQLRSDAERYGLADFDGQIAWLEAHKGAVISEEPRICHGDFHPLNILDDGRGHLSVVDWGGATVGDRHADVANTIIELTLVPTTSLSRWQRARFSVTRRIAASRYLACYRRELPLEPARLRYWEALLVVRWSLQFSLVVRDGSAAYGLKAETTAFVQPSHVAAFGRRFEKLARG